MGNASNVPLSHHPTSEDAMGARRMEQHWGGQGQSLVLLGVLRVKQLHVCEREEPFPPVDFSFPLPVYVHPRHLHNISNLQKQKHPDHTRLLASDTNQMNNTNKPIMGKKSCSLLGRRINWKVTFTELQYQHFVAKHNNVVCALCETLNYKYI